ncbi:MAG: MFS transporter [Ktedonobacter sp. 13_1_20CM_3_54_15]|nr:MAG: MFS transporter [Ktedonobacter sp. 13_2_20CM_53_11]OLE33047.1 MAG: MFS transporter [Ktedonobacter sp. 13_1_20CM_3_54_15]
MSETQESTRKSPIVRVAMASLIGTSIEWYDFFLYGTAAALVLGPLFFSPKLSPLAAQLSAFATFWVGFAARPVGGIVFGHFGDRLGRKAMLILTLMIMGIATFLVGVLPTYKDIGIIAPVLLVIVRFAQGFAVGGEWGGAVLMATEHSPAARRGFFGSWPQFGVPIGLLLSSLIFGLVTSSFSKAAFLSIGWRIPFLLSIVLVAIGLFIRLRLTETPDFERVRETRTIARLPVIDVLRTNLKSVVLAAGAFFVTNGAFYIYVTFIISYGEKILKVPGSTMLTGVLVGAVAMGITILAAGALSDRLGRLPVYLTGAAFVGLMAFPVFLLIDTRSPALIALALAIGIGGIGIMYGPQAAFFSELFGANVRYSGASLGYQITAIFAGGLAPFIATALLAQFNNASWPIALYIVGMAIITLVCTYLAGETRPSAAAELADGTAGN